MAIACQSFQPTPNLVKGTTLVRTNSYLMQVDENIYVSDMASCSHGGWGTARELGIESSLEEGVGRGGYRAGCGRREDGFDLDRH